MTTIREIMQADEVEFGDFFREPQSSVPEETQVHQRTVNESSRENLVDEILADEEVVGRIDQTYNREPITIQNIDASMVQSQLNTESRGTNTSNDENTSETQIDVIQRKLQTIFIVTQVNKLFGPNTDMYSKQLLNEFQELFEKNLTDIQISKVMLLLKKQASTRYNTISLVGGVVTDIFKSQYFKDLLGDQMIDRFSIAFDALIANTSCDVFEAPEIISADEQKLVEISQSRNCKWQDILQFAGGFTFSVLLKLLLESLREIESKTNNQTESSPEKNSEEVHDTQSDIIIQNDVINQSDYNKPLYHLPNYRNVKSVNIDHEDAKSSVSSKSRQDSSPDYSETSSCNIPVETRIAQYESNGIIVNSNNEVYCEMCNKILQVFSKGRFDKSKLVRHINGVNHRAKTESQNVSLS